MFSQTRISAAANSDSILPGDYPPRDLGRMLKHARGNLYTSYDCLTSRSSQQIRPRRLLPHALQAASPAYDFDKEQSFFKMLLHAINDMSNHANETSVSNLIKKQWAAYTQSDRTDIEGLIKSSSNCSEFLILWLFYGLKASKRPSNRYENKNVQSKTVHKYLKELFDHLYPKLKGNSFYLMMKKPSKHYIPIA